MKRQHKDNVLPVTCMKENMNDNGNDKDGTKSSTFIIQPGQTDSHTTQTRHDQVRI